MKITLTCYPPSSKKDINQASENHITSDVKKTMDMEEFLQAILKIEEFWLQFSKLAD